MTMESFGVVLSGDRWVGKGFTSVYSKIEELINSAKHNITIAVYQFTSEHLLSLVNNALKRGVSIVVYTNYALRVPDHPSFKAYIIKDKTLHAKIIIVDGRKILVGSSNYTFSGFFRNYEIGVYFEDSEIASRLSELIMEMSG